MMNLTVSCRQAFVDEDGAGTRFFYWNRRLLLAALLAGLLYWRST